MSIEQNQLNRRKFLGVAGGVAIGAAAAAAAACADTHREPNAAAATPPPGDGSDHGAAGGSALAGDRPQPSGQVATVRDAALPPVLTGPLVIEAVDAQVEVAGGVKLNAWTFDGTVPGRTIHLRQGDAVDFTLSNKGKMGHSIDFHAAQTPPNVNYKTIAPNTDLKFTWKANHPGVFMYHCGTGPVIEHLSNGMYGAVVVDPAEPLPAAREYVLVQSEFYLKQNADGATWDGDVDRANAVQPDFVVFNGASLQYQQQTLPAAPGELIRLYVVNAGPTLFSAFHVIGAIFDRVYADGNPANIQRGISTWTIPPGGGATFEMTVPEAGKYPFVTHNFAYTGLGAVGMIEVK